MYAIRSYYDLGVPTTFLNTSFYWDNFVHFTILRPPYKSDNASEDELALIAFPTEELFEAKLKERNNFV